MTSDISRSGILVAFEKSGSREMWLGVGDLVRIVLVLPRSRHLSPRCLDCVAVAVRVADNDEEPRQVAFEFRRVKVRNRDEASLRAEPSLESTGLHYVH